jgi:CRISPR system Cascade subunit CasE
MGVWLTRIVLDTRNRAVRADLRDAVKLHKRVMMLVPDDLGAQARANTGILFRLEEGRAAASLLVQAKHRPDPTRLPSGYGTAAVKALDPLLDGLSTGMPVHYRIAANPSKRLAKADASHKAKQVIPLSGTAAEEWWARKAVESGLTLSTLLATAISPARGENGPGGPIRHSITRFDGIAVIANPDLVRTAILDGIGRGKSYGCGLLSLAPVKT